MKFEQLQLGQRFDWNGATYVKAGPVVAREEATGKSRMIPRYAVLKPVGEMPVAGKKKPSTTLDREAVLEAMEKFLAECEEIVSQCGDSKAGARLQTAKQRLLDAL